MYTCPRAHNLAHRYRLSITIHTMEDRGHLDPQGTLSPLLAPGMFYVGFSPHNFSSPRFFRGIFFPWVCWPLILNTLIFIWSTPGEFCAYTSQSDSTRWTVLATVVFDVSFPCVLVCFVVLVLSITFTFAVVAPWSPIYLLRDMWYYCMRQRIMHAFLEWEVAVRSWFPGAVLVLVRLGTQADASYIILCSSQWIYFLAVYMITTLR